MQKKTRRSCQNKMAALTLAICTMLSSGNVFAMPQGGEVQSGTVTGVNEVKDNTMTMNQATARAAINWQSFDIAKGESVVFKQPSAAAIALNRVVGSNTSASEIAGNLTANGQVFLINQNGVLFKDNASVNVGGLIASTKDLTNADGTAMDFTKFADTTNTSFRFAGDSDGVVLNRAVINAEGGVVALLANQVTNEGTINTTNGSTALVAAPIVNVDYEGDGKINLSVDGSVADARVINSNDSGRAGTISANGGWVYMTARGANAALNTVVRSTGIIEAKSMSSNGGVVSLDGGDNGVVEMGGTINAAGGAVKATGANIYINQDGSYDDKTIKRTLDLDVKTVDLTATATAAEGQTNANAADIVISGAINKTGSEDTTMNLSAGRNILVEAPISAADGGKLNLTLTSATTDAAASTAMHNAVTANNNYGANILEADINTNGGSFTANGGTYLGLTQTELASAVNGATKVNRTINTDGGNLTINGDLVLATGYKATLNAGSTGDVDVKGTINSGNAYSYVSAEDISWDDALAAAKSGSAASTADGDTYLATITSGIEDSAIASTMPKTGSTEKNEAFVGGKAEDWTTDSEGNRVSRSWKWVSGPEAGTTFYTQTNTSLNVNNTASTGTASGYTNWRQGEPNDDNYAKGQGALAVNYDSYNDKAKLPSRWDDLDADNKMSIGYVKETNLAASSLDITGKNVQLEGAVGTEGIRNTALNNVTVNAQKNITVNAITADGNIKLSSVGGNDASNGGVVTLNGDLTSHKTGDHQAVVVGTEGTFVNHAGSDAIQVGEGSNWQVYSYGPDSDAFGSLNSNNQAIWGHTYSDGLLDTTVNQYIFEYQPTVTVTANDTTKDQGKLGTGNGVAYSMNSTDRAMLEKYTDAFTDGNYTSTPEHFLSGTPGLTSEGFPTSAESGKYSIDVSGNLTSGTGLSSKVCKLI